MLLTPSAMLSGRRRHVGWHQHASCSSSPGAVTPAATFKFDACSQTKRKSVQHTLDKTYHRACCPFDYINGTTFCIRCATFCTSRATSSTARASWASDAKWGAANSDARLIGFGRMLMPE